MSSAQPFSYTQGLGAAPSFRPTGRKSSFWTGSDESVMTSPTMTQGQIDLLEKLLGKSQKAIDPAYDFLTQLLSGDETIFQQLEQPAIRAFEEDIAPGIAERFSGAGAGAQGSSAFQQQLATAGSRLAQSLGEQRTGLRMSALDRVLSQLDRPLGYQPYSQAYVPKQSGFLQEFGLGLPSIFGRLIGGR